MASLIKKGKYRYVNENITPENFPNAEIRGEVELVRPRKEFTEAEGIAMLQAQGLEPATALELIAWGAENRELPEKWDCIIALGEYWLDPCRHRRIVYLRRDPEYRGLGLDCSGIRFYDYCVLAGVRRRNQPLEPQAVSASSDPLSLSSLAERVKVLEDWKVTLIKAWNGNEKD